MDASMGTGYAQPGSGDRPDVGRLDSATVRDADRTRSGDRSRPTLLVNPPTDLRLRATLDEVMEEQAPRTPAELETIVRPVYPRIVVRARSLEHESVVVWYVYREGYWVPSTVDAAPAESAPSAPAAVLRLEEDAG
jgi:hypothetical protein